MRVMKGQTMAVVGESATGLFGEEQGLDFLSSAGRRGRFVVHFVSRIVRGRIEIGIGGMSGQVGEAGRFPGAGTSR